MKADSKKATTATDETANSSEVSEETQCTITWTYAITL